MSRAKQLIGDYLTGLASGKKPAGARRTEFRRLRDGRIRRRVVRADGTVEKQQTLPATQAATSAARAGTGMSQQAFARLLGVSRRTLQEWEQGRKQPSGAARVLLKIAAHRPKVLLEATN